MFEKMLVDNGEISQLGACCDEKVCGTWRRRTRSNVNTDNVDEQMVGCPYRAIVQRMHMEHCNPPSLVNNGFGRVQVGMGPLPGRKETNEKIEKEQTGNSAVA